ncbi:MAG: hypothetical protein V4750_02860 [Pseudomonadota bacterium]
MTKPADLARDARAAIGNGQSFARAVNDVTVLADALLAASAEIARTRVALLSLATDQQAKASTRQRLRNLAVELDAFLKGGKREADAFRSRGLGNGNRAD